MPFSCWPSNAHCQAMIPVSAAGILITAANGKFHRATSLKLGLKLGLRRTRGEIEQRAAQVQCNWEVDQHYVLRVFRQQHGFRIERIQHQRRADLPAHLTMTWPVIFACTEQKYG
jgi:hypothetical protein